MVGSVTPLDELSSDPSKLDALCGAVREQFRTYIVQLLERMNRTVSTIHLPEDPTALSFAVAGAMDIPLLDKQRLLEAPSTDARLEMETELLKSQTEASREVVESPKEKQPGEPAKPQTAKIKRLTASAARALVSRN
jgi:ATP-dependent Lon protease